MQFSSNWRYSRRLLTLYKKKLLILPLEFLADLSKTVQEECLPLSGYLCLQIFTPRELSFRGLDKTHKSAKLTFLPIETLCIFVFLSFCLFFFFFYSCLFVYVSFCLLAFSICLFVYLCACPSFPLFVNCFAPNEVWPCFSTKKVKEDKRW